LNIYFNACISSSQPLCSYYELIEIIVFVGPIWMV